MPQARPADFTDLPQLLALFGSSEVSAVAEPRDRAEHILREMLDTPGLEVFVTDDGDRIGATCVLVTAPNLLRGGRRHGFIENVVTHPILRGTGHGSGARGTRTGLGRRLPSRAAAERQGRSPRAPFLRGAGLQAGYVAHRPA